VSVAGAPGFGPFGGVELAALSGMEQVFVDGAMMIAPQYMAAYRAAPIPDVVADALAWRRFRHRSAFTDGGIYHRARCRACRVKWNFLSAAHFSILFFSICRL
jgi:hypothetical protein